MSGIYQARQLAGDHNPDIQAMVVAFFFHIQIRNATIQKCVRDYRLRRDLVAAGSRRQPRSSAAAAGMEKTRHPLFAKKSGNSADCIFDGKNICGGKKEVFVWEGP